MRASFARWVPLGGLCLLTLRLAACSSGGGTGPNPEVGGAADSTSAGVAGNAGASQASGHGGQPTTAQRCIGDCELDRRCSGDTQVIERVACVVTSGGSSNGSGYCADGPSETIMIPCPTGQHCSAGLCLTHAAAPTTACESASDCGLPPSTCAERDLVIFTDPSCDGGQCRWKELIESCGGASPGCDAASGQCAFPPVFMTASGAPPNPMPDLSQPEAAPEQSCAQASDCAAPAPSCYRASTVNYVNPSCEAGSCVFSLDISECPYPNHACQAGACL
jgi:hypothetical protein